VKSIAIYRYGHGLHSFDAVRRSAQPTLCTLTTLEKREETEVYKVITGKEGIDSSIFFTVASNDYSLSRHQFKLYKQSAHHNIRGNFFSERVLNDWNRLPSHVVKAPPSTHLITDWITTWQIWATKKLTFMKSK